MRVIVARAAGGVSPGRPGVALQDEPVHLDAKTGTITSIPAAGSRTRWRRPPQDPVNKKVYVHAGTYRPAARGQALIWFNARHDGITLEAVGDVILTAANPEIADKAAPSYPAVVNHVVYFGDGMSRKTVFRGFKVTGANNFTTGSGEKSPIESDDIRKTVFFYTDGGGIKIYARSYPTIEDVEVYEQLREPVRRRGIGRAPRRRSQESVLFRNCIFRNNRTQTTGSALDLLHGSAATVENCLFVGNVANMGVDVVGLLTGGEFHPETWLRRDHGLSGIEAHDDEEHDYRQLERRGRQREGQHLRRFDLLDELARRRHLAGQAVRAGPRRRRRRARVVHSRRRQRFARDRRQSREHLQSSGSALRRALRAAGAGVQQGRLPAEPSARASRK